MTCDKMDHGWIAPLTIANPNGTQFIKITGSSLTHCSLLNLKSSHLSICSNTTSLNVGGGLKNRVECLF